jgi:hypothetical protein
VDPVTARLRRLAVRIVVAVRRTRWHRIERALLQASRRGDARRAAWLLRRISLDIAAGRGRLRGRRLGRRRLPRIAVLERAQFTDDARALAADLGDTRVLLIPREALKAIARGPLPQDTGDLTYRRLLAEDPAPMQRYRALLGAIWSAFDPDGDVRLVMTANTGYWAEIELGAALEEAAVPFVALHKENLKSPGHAALWEDAYRTMRPPFLGRTVVVQNEGERTLQARSGLVPAERLTAVGMARMDAFHEHRHRTAGTVPAGDILFAGFLPGLNLPAPDGFRGRDAATGLPLPHQARRPEHLVEACLALHRTAIAVARSAPDRTVVLKTKGRDQDRRWTDRILELTRGAEALPENLVVAHGGDAVTLTQQAGVVVGLNSTVLLEAIAAGRPTVVLELGEVRDTAADFLVDLGGAASIVRDEAAAVPTILGLAADPPRVPHTLDDRSIAVLERWAGNADGRATERTVAVLQGLLSP